MTYASIPPDPNRPPPPPRPSNLVSPTAPGPRIQPTQWGVWWMIIIGMIASCAMWMSADSSDAFQRTGIYFVLIPGTMAAILAILPLPRGSLGLSATRGVAIIVLSTALLLREGFICVIMASPIIAIVVLLVVGLVKLVSKGPTTLLIPLLLVSFGSEGLTWDVDRDISGAESRTLEVSTDELWTALAAPANLPEIEPLLFALPFPEPTRVTGSGVDIGDARQVHFSPGGELELTVADRGSNHVEWRVTSDTTPMSGWMTFHAVRAEWVETQDGIELAVTITADRSLAPGFYFGPLQRWGVAEMADVLADMIQVNLHASR